MYKIKKTVPHVCQVVKVTNLITGITINEFAIAEKDRVQLEWKTLCQCYKCGRIVVTDVPIKREEESIIIPGVVNAEEDSRKEG